jgi:phospholipid/cholesterol/gamma-HCH transport system ATP-binding protein
MDPPPEPALTVDKLTVAFGEKVIQQDVSFKVAAGSIFAVMGGSGSGKSTLLQAMIGLLEPTAGKISVGEEDYWAATEERRAQIDRGFGVLFQSGAMWTAMTVTENVALPLRMLTDLGGPAIDALARVKLALVGLADSGELMPAALSGGMTKRAGLARALALDPAILFLDEPSSGLDPMTARRLDDLILDLREGFQVTIVLVSHDLPSLFDICDDGIFLDGDTHTAIAHGAPKSLRDNCQHPTVRAFMHRERAPADGAAPEARRRRPS